jgi:DNA-binding Lrp family transcriptional regulator
MSTSTDEGWTFNGFIFPTTTPIPDQVFDELLHLLSGNELKVLLYICRRTFGFKKESDTISLNQMVNGITTRDGRVLDRGTGLSKATVTRCLNTLEERNIILRIRQYSDERGDEPTTYSLNILNPLSQIETRGVSSLRQGGVSVVKQGVSQGRDTPVSHQRDTQQTVVQQTVLQETERQQQPARVTSTNGNALAAPDPAVVVALVNQGLGKGIATKLAQTHPADRIEQKIDYLTYLLETNPTRVENPRGWLRRAIEEDYGAPDGYRSPEERDAEARRQAEQQARIERELADADARDAARTAEAAQREQTLQEQYGLSERERALWATFLTVIQPSHPGIGELLVHSLLLQVTETTALLGTPTTRVADMVRGHPGVNKVVTRTLGQVIGHPVELELVVVPALSP